MRAESGDELDVGTEGGMVLPLSFPRCFVRRMRLLLFSSWVRLLYLTVFREVLYADSIDYSLGVVADPVEAAEVEVVSAAPATSSSSTGLHVDPFFFFVYLVGYPVFSLRVRGRPLHYARFATTPCRISP